MLKKFTDLPTLDRLLTDPGIPYIDRDLSWLQFNDRVLEEALDPSNPLLERAKFLSITASNLDEFFMIRVASLNRKIFKYRRQKKRPERNRLERTANTIFREVRKFADRQRGALRELSKAFLNEKVHIVRFKQKSPHVLKLGKELFEKNILPRLGPPLPFQIPQLLTLKNLQMAILLGENQWMAIPQDLALVHSIQDPSSGDQFIFFTDDLLSTYVPSFFGIRCAPNVIRLTRDGDISVYMEDEDPESIPDVVRSKLQMREFGEPVRFQYTGPISSRFLHKIISQLKIHPRQAVASDSILSLPGLRTPFAKERGYPTLPPIVHSVFKKNENPFTYLKGRDILLHHPYDSFDTYVKWILIVCNDPQVETIEQTIYRTDALSPIIHALKEAAKHKKVHVVIELRASFDELNNLTLADELRKAGVQVSFGFGNLKLHAKIALVTRKEETGIQYYTHLSTGNYHTTTARQYTDIGILTSNPEIGSDARQFFDSIYTGEVPKQLKRLVHAPDHLHDRILSLIHSEMKAAKGGKESYIFAKVNALVDKSIIEKLYEASDAGVKIDLVVRGTCSLIPGVKGLSEHIRVVSIVDRYLEHSRIYYFKNSETMYVSSADWMPRNFFSRLEFAFPVLDGRLVDYVRLFMIPGYLNDNVKIWELLPSGNWKKKRPVKEIPEHRAQFYFEDLAQKEYLGTSLA